MFCISLSCFIFLCLTVLQNEDTSQVCINGKPVFVDAMYQEVVHAFADVKVPKITRASWIILKDVSPNNANNQFLMCKEDDVHFKI